MSNAQVDYACKAVDELRQAVEQLAGCLQQGVARPWKTPALTVERREQLDKEARAERFERSDIAPGESPAPLDLDVMDSLVEILAAAEVLATDLADALSIDRPTPATSAFADPRPHLRFITKALRAMTDPAEGVPLLHRVEDRAKDLLERAQETLGLVTDGQVLKALCPWCGGRSETAPNGGEHTLRVRNVRNLGLTVVVCEGGSCEPPPEDCGTRVRGNPAWIDSEWDWLAKRIEHAADTGRAS